MRRCGVCGKPPREGEEMFPIRIPEDVAEAKSIEHGLYLACLECTEEHRARVAKQLGKDPKNVTNNELA